MAGAAGYVLACGHIMSNVVFVVYAAVAASDVVVTGTAAAAVVVVAVGGGGGSDVCTSRTINWFHELALANVQPTVLTPFYSKQRTFL